MSKPVYESPLSGRYASAEMQRIFSPDHRYGLWRRLWLALAESEQALGLDITDAQLDEMRAHLDDIDYEIVEAREREVRHDVMAHIYAFGKCCPQAMPIIHLGATSCYVTDNAEILILRDALTLLREKLVGVLCNLNAFAQKYRALPCLGYTHLQPAQPVTVGKRACLWAYDFYQDLCEMEYRLSTLALLGSKGTTGTQASFLELFCGDTEKVQQLDAMIAGKMGFPGVVPVSGQTYSRKQDSFVSATLAGLAESAHKFASDLRLLQSFKEVEEPFEAHQIGSSAMPYKRNPMRSERICSLSRCLIANAAVSANTAATQWMERTLDDSAAKRITLPESFLLADGILELLNNITNGLVVNDKVIEARLSAELPFMMVENILMREVKNGADRQVTHEKLRAHALAAAARVKQEGASNDLLDRIAADADFSLNSEELKKLADPALYVGIAPQQTDAFCNDVLRPVFERYPEIVAEFRLGKRGGHVSV